MALGMETGMSNKLLPCPFCGGEAHLLVGDSGIIDVCIECLECETRGPTFEEYPPATLDDNEATAVKHWNTRWTQ